MNLSESVSQLKKVNIVLDQITVKGRDNMDRLLGCIQVIDYVIQQLENGMAELNKPAAPTQQPKIEIVPEPEEE